MRCSGLLCRAVTGLPLLAFVAGSAHAQDLIPLIDIDPNVDLCVVRACDFPQEVVISDPITSPRIVGTGIGLTEAVTVTALGVFDEGRDGLAAETTVGIFADTVGPLASATVPAGIETPLVGSFRTVAVGPLELAPGFYHVLSIATPADPVVHFSTLGVQPPPIDSRVAEILLSSAAGDFSPDQFDQIQSPAVALSASTSLGPNVFTPVPEPIFPSMSFFFLVVAAHKRRSLHRDKIPNVFVPRTNRFLRTC